MKQLNYHRARHRARHGSLCFDFLLVPKFDHYIKACSFLQAEKLTTKPSPFGKINGLVKGKQSSFSNFLFFQYFKCYAVV